MSAKLEIARNEAARWHARLQSEDASEQDWLQFEAWLSHPANNAAYEELEHTLSAVEAQRPALTGRSSQRRLGFNLRPSAWVMAGAALAAIVLAIVTLAPEKSEEVAYAAAFDATRSVTLDDASTVELNRGATLRARISAKARDIVLEHGEAAFAVRHDASRPFSVRAGDVTLTDIGTEFDVVHAQTYVVVTVREGAVAFISAGRKGDLIAGQQARWENGAVTVSAINPDDAFSWRTGRLTYRNAPLSRVVEDINRYTSRPLVIADSRAAALRFSGVLVIEQPEAMIRRLEAFLPIQSAQDAGRIELRSRP